MKHTFLFLVPVLMFFSCKSKSKQALSDSTEIHNSTFSDYPVEIKNLGLENLYDNTKWVLYCIHSDEKLDFIRQSNIKDTVVTFGMLPLKFDNLLIRDDTVEINFLFYYNNKKANVLLIDNTPTWGVVYVGEQDTVVWYSAQSTGRYFKFTCGDLKNCPDRTVIPLQPEVIQYIKANSNKIDPWFRKEAIKRGVIKNKIMEALFLL